MAEGDVTLNVIFPIDQQLYDAVMEQAGRIGVSLDALYSDACTDSFAQLPGVERQHDRALRMFHIEELGNREHMGGLMQATLVLSADLYTAMQAIARDQKKPVEAICEGLCVKALQTKTGISKDMNKTDRLNQL
jgi:hypothetical protein